MGRDEFRARCEALFGRHGWQAALSRALGRSNTCVRNWTAGRAPVPPEVVAVVEFLEVAPAASWPPRWSELARRRAA